MKVEVKLSSMNQILEKDLSMFDRGVLISLILSKDNDAQIHWAKFKTKSIVNDAVRESLIGLHKRKLIVWSGVDQAINKLEDNSNKEILAEIVDFMNGVWGSKFRNSKHSTTGINARLKEFTVEEIKLVISNRWNEWKDDPLMHKFLTPQTVFRPKNFAKYLAHAQQTGIGEGVVKASKINLIKGDVLDTKNTKDFSNRDTYNVRICEATKDGFTKVGSRIEVMHGKAIKRALKLLQFKEENGFAPDLYYLYWPND